MKFSVLSSGSKANATIVECGSTRLLIDCGLSARRLEERLAEVKIEPETISGILVSHEHSDHVLGLSVFSRRHRIPVFMNDLTHRAYKDGVRNHKIFKWESFSAGPSSPTSQCTIGGVDVSTFSIPHDAADPIGFKLHFEGLTLVHCTDLGRVTRLVNENISGAHAMVLESNHDEELLQACEYPWDLKERIRSTHGHLSNHAAGALIGAQMEGTLGQVVLAHLSEHSNTPEVALATVRSYLSESSRLCPPGRVHCASIHAATPLFDVAELACSPLGVSDAARMSTDDWRAA